MESDDLLCSRNARPQKAVVERAQWKAGSLHPQWVTLIEEVDHNGQLKSMSAIREIKGRQIVDSQGNPTVEEE
jgi:hypothetical protein